VLGKGVGAAGTPVGANCGVVGVGQGNDKVVGPGVAGKATSGGGRRGVVVDGASDQLVTGKAETMPEGLGLGEAVIEGAAMKEPGFCRSTSRGSFLDKPAFLFPA